MPGPAIDTIDGDTDLPAEAEIVIIGGGIIGCATALELAERGVACVLLEKGVIAGEQSSRNWGWVRMSRRDPRGDRPDVRLHQDMGSARRPRGGRSGLSAMRYRRAVPQRRVSAREPRLARAYPGSADPRGCDRDRTSSAR